MLVSRSPTSDDASGDGSDVEVEKLFRNGD
jgi:hypothetical protein